MDKKKIEERKETLIKQRDQAFAQFNALNGAIQDCDYWLEQIGKKEK